MRESLGAALLRAGRPGEAEAVYREALRRSPRNGRLLFGLLESLKAQNNTAAVSFVEQQFKEAWGKSSETLRIEDY